MPNTFRALVNVRRRVRPSSANTTNERRAPTNRRLPSQHKVLSMNRNVASKQRCPMPSTAHRMATITLHPCAEYKYRRWWLRLFEIREHYSKGQLSLSNYLHIQFFERRWGRELPFGSKRPYRKFMIYRHIYCLATHQEYYAHSDVGLASRHTHHINERLFFPPSISFYVTFKLVPCEARTRSTDSNVHYTSCQWFFMQRSSQVTCTQPKWCVTVLTGESSSKMALHASYLKLSSHLNAFYTFSVFPYLWIINFNHIGWCPP